MRKIVKGTIVAMLLATIVICLNTVLFNNWQPIIYLGLAAVMTIIMFVPPQAGGNPS